MTDESHVSVCGVVLAAGAGMRAGGPKALRRSKGGESWIARAAGTLSAAGCDRVVVVLGAAAEDARALVPPGTDAVVVPDWASGMASSLRAGVAAASGIAALITLVDLPALPVSVAERMLRDVSATALRQAVFGGRPGHPVLIGRDHWAPFAASLAGDHGGRQYLVGHGVVEVECADLWDGLDRDEG